MRLRMQTLVISALLGSIVFVGFNCKKKEKVTATIECADFSTFCANVGIFNSGFLALGQLKVIDTTRADCRVTQAGHNLVGFEIDSTEYNHHGFTREEIQKMFSVSLSGSYQANEAQLKDTIYSSLNLQVYGGKRYDVSRALDKLNADSSIVKFMREQIHNSKKTAFLVSAVILVDSTQLRINEKALKKAGLAIAAFNLDLKIENSCNYGFDYVAKPNEKGVAYVKFLGLKWDSTNGYITSEPHEVDWLRCQFPDALR